MKIHFLINSLVAGGAERVMILLANYFAEKKHNITIITFNDPEDFRPNDKVQRIRLHNGKIKNHTIRSIYNLSKLYTKKNNRPDILIPFMTHGNFIGILVGKLFRIKVISSEHNNHLKKTDSLGNFTRNYLYRLTDVLTVLTNYDYEFYKNRKVNVQIMPNPSTFDIFKEQNRQRKKVILAVGDLNRYHHKGFDNLIPIIAPVLKKNKEWSLKIVGAGDKGYRFLNELVIKHNISNQVVFEGYSTKVAEIMKRSEIYVMTSRFEGLPMVLLEAMSQGMACISYDCKTGPSDIIQNNYNGILVEDQNSKSMAENINNLINNTDLRIKLSNNGINSLDRFKIEGIYEKYLKIFQQLEN